MKAIGKNLYQKMRSQDYYILLPYIILCLIGVVMVYSASAAIRLQTGGSPTGYLIKQIFFVALGWGFCSVVTNMNIQMWRGKKFLPGFYVVMLVLLVYVKFFGRAVNGANGWIHFGMFSLQPAELCKLFLIAYWADRGADIAEKHNREFKQNWYPIFLTAILLVLILIQPDVGGLTINLAIVVIMVMASGYSSKGMSLLLVGGLILASTLLNVVARVAAGHIKNYQAARFIAFINPFGTQKGAGSQLVNSYYAISNGGLSGAGLGNSMQKMGYLPEPNTDFIMAVTSEELGFFGVALILILLMIMICRMIIVGAKAQSMYEGLICYGVATFLMVEASINIGGVTGLLPITGVTFPFISYGGSSMIVLSLSLGLALNVSVRQNMQRLGLKKPVLIKGGAQ